MLLCLKYSFCDIVLFCSYLTSDPFSNIANYSDSGNATFASNASDPLEMQMYKTETQMWKNLTIRII